jgi:hypothetical protein
MNRIFKHILLILTAAAVVTAQQQISIPRIEQMPDHPQPYVMRNWDAVAKGYDSLVFNTSATGEHLPLSSLYSNTVNYPLSTGFKLKTYVGSPGSGGEAINCLPAVIGAGLTGINKRNQNGIDWAAMCKEWFNMLPAERVYLNSPRASSGDDWWYETMPNVFFYQLYDQHPSVPEFAAQAPVIAGRWLQAVRAMGGSSIPWTRPNMDHRAWKLSTMTPNNTGVHEPEASGAIGWILYQAYIKTGDERYRIGAEWTMEYLSAATINPSYELQLPYGVAAAARMNAELGTSYDVQKMFTWCFDIGPLRSWGTTVGTWGNYDASGLVGEVQEFQPAYAFLMNTMQQVGALTPVARYDDRFARAIGKWVLNAANSSRLFYSSALPAANQDGESWSGVYDPASTIGYEAIKQTENAVSPYATGDAVKNGWAATNFALYGSSHVGYLAAVVDTTDIPQVLRLDLLATDFGHGPAYPSFLFFNPYDSTVTVSVHSGDGLHDLYDAVSNTFAAQNVTGAVPVPLSANSARVLVIVPSGGSVTYHQERMLVNGVVVDYRSSAAVPNHPPRIKSAASSHDTLLLGHFADLFCTAEDQDGDTVTYRWTTMNGMLFGEGSQVTWKAPDTPGVYSVIATVKDSKQATSSDTIMITVVAGINHIPVIKKIRVTPRKMDLNTTATVTSIAEDSDGDTLSYAWSSAAGAFTGSGNSVTWTSPSTVGNYTIYSTVTDGFGGTAKESILVQVRDFSLFVKGNLLAYYPFNGTANDFSGNNRHGTAVNVTPSNDRYGTPNAAYAFDGLTSAVQIPNDNGLNSTQSVGANFWMTIGAFYEREQYPVSHGNYSNRWKVSISNKRLRWTVKTTMGIKDLDSETELVKDSLYNISVNYTGAEMEIYLNGELDAFVPWSGPVAQTTIDLTVGKVLPNDNNYNFNGVLDDLRLFDYGLSMPEIAALSARPTSVRSADTPPFPSLFSLRSYPNPFNPAVTLRLSLPSSAYVRVTIVDLLGRVVATPVDGTLPAGTTERRWQPEGAASGIYFCVGSAGGRTVVQKLIYMR